MGGDLSRISSDPDPVDRFYELSILDAIEADDIHRMAEQPTLINLVNLLLLEAIQSRSSDVASVAQQKALAPCRTRLGVLGMTRMTR